MTLSFQLKCRASVVAAMCFVGFPLVMLACLRYGYPKNPWDTREWTNAIILCYALGAMGLGTMVYFSFIDISGNKEAP